MLVGPGLVNAQRIPQISHVVRGSHPLGIMQVLVRHDDNIQGGQRLEEIVIAAVEGGLDRFRDDITAVDVHLADENGPKTGGEPRTTCEIWGIL